MLIDQGSGVEIMYPDLYRGLGLKPEDSSKYDTPLVEFDRKVVRPERQIKLSVVIEENEVKVNFIGVNDFLPYAAILG